jgi:2-polyprenyl-3-methyl-5-hydroxy-6-metoxy-1,4-benzoquinol methylase
LNDHQRNIFDGQWESYWLQVQSIGPLTHTRYRLLKALLPKRFARPPRVLDVGCGPGHFLQMLLREIPGAAAYGMEPSASAIAAAPNGIRERIMCGDIVRDGNSLGPEPFDLIICSEVLEHVENPANVVDAIVRLAASDALILFSVPAGMKHWSAQDEQAGHLRRFDLDEFRKMIESAGLEIRQIYTWGGPISWLYNHAINRVGARNAAGAANSGIGRLAAGAATILLRFDDLFVGKGRFQLICSAVKRQSAR